MSDTLARFAGAVRDGSGEREALAAAAKTGFFTTDEIMLADRADIELLAEALDVKPSLRLSIIARLEGHK